MYHGYEPIALTLAGTGNGKSLVSYQTESPFSLPPAKSDTFLSQCNSFGTRLLILPTFSLPSISSQLLYFSI